VDDLEVVWLEDLARVSIVLDTVDELDGCRVAVLCEVRDRVLASLDGEEDLGHIGVDEHGILDFVHHFLVALLEHVLDQRRVVDALR
jgi:hypothetical protein